jgi:tight adherence protein B
MLIPGLIFAVVFVVVFGAYWAFVLGPEEREGQALRRRLGGTRSESRTGIQTVVKTEQRFSSVEPLNRLLSSLQPVNAINGLLERSGSKQSPGTVLLGSVFLGLVGLLIAFQLTSRIALGVAAGAAFAMLPFIYLRRKARRRLIVFEEQFPEAIDLMARALRAGHALPTALQNVGDEIPDPVGGEFRTLFEQQNYGISLPDALRAFAMRVPVLDARFFVTAVLTQRETGGNLSEILDNLAGVIRERFKVKRHVRVVSAHGRITGWVLGCLPLALTFVLYLIAPDHIGLLWTDPLGFNMLLAGLFLQVVGVLIIRRIIDVEY